MPRYRISDEAGQTSMDNLNLTYRNEPKLLSNKVFIPWYKRYMNTLPEHEQMEFQPYEEIDRRDEDIAMQFVYGDDCPDVSDEKLMKSIRREAVMRHQSYKERMEKREESTRGAEGFPKARASIESKFSAPSVQSIIAKRKAGNKVPGDFDGGKMTDQEKNTLRGITDYINRKRQLTRRRRTMTEMKENGFSVWDSKWSLLFKPKNKMIIAMTYRVAHKAKVRMRFRRIINLVCASNRFFFILGEISGDTGAMVKDIRDFQTQQMAFIEQNKSTQSDAKFIFEPSKFKLSTETPVPMSVLFTLTKPWYDRNQTEIDLAIKSLQVLRCFAELPSNTQRHLAMVAWFITVPEDKVMIRQAQEAQDCYLLLSGRVSKTVFVGEPHGEQPGVFSYIMSYTKDSIFGEEALTKPGSEREYSVTSCVACDMLSINVHDYFSCTMMPSDVRSSAPDHVKFISHCDFLKNFPKTMLVEDAESNLYLTYFRPGLVIETSMSDAKWVYVVKWGSCRALCEVSPSRKAREAHYDRMSWIPPDSETGAEVLMQDRMTEPLKRTAGTPRSSGEFTRALRKSVVLAVNNELRERQNEHAEKKKGSDDRSITENINEVQDKKRNISGLLRAKRKQDMKEKEKEKERTVRTDQSIPTLMKTDEDSTLSFLSSSDSKNVRSSSTHHSSFGSPSADPVRLPSIYRERASIGERFNGDSDNSKRPSFCLPDNVNEDAKFDEKYKDSDEDNDEDSELIFSVQSKTKRKSMIGSQYKVDKFVEKTFILPEVNDVDSELPLSSLKALKHTTHYIKEERKEASFESSVDSSERRALNNKKKSRVSIEESLAAIQINKARMNRRGTANAEVMKKETPQTHSIWKLNKNLVKGDQIGFEFIDLQDGNFRQPDENPSLVSDGCELVLIRKAFLLKHLGLEARLDEFVIDQKGEMTAK